MADRMNIGAGAARITAVAKQREIGIRVLLFLFGIIIGVALTVVFWSIFGEWAKCGVSGNTNLIGESVEGSNADADVV